MRRDRCVFPVDEAYLEAEKDSVIRQYQTKVRKRIIRRNGNRYLLAGVPLTWLKDLPQGTVVIDPTVSFNASEDSYIRSGAATTNYGGATSIYIGNSSGVGTVRGLFKFDISSIPSNARVTGATFKVYYNTIGGYPFPTDRPVACYKLLKHWTENYVNWFETYSPVMDPWGTSGVGFDNVDADSTPVDTKTMGYNNISSYINYNVLPMVQDWLGGEANHGMILRATDDSQARDYKVINSSEALNNKPQLSITYQELKKFFYLKDHLGNIRVTINDEREVVGYDDYPERDAFGVIHLD